MITFEEIVRNEEVQELVLAVEQQLEVLGYTEHSIRHMNLVAKRAGMILEELEYPKERIELAQIAGYLHDIGNAVNRVDHAHTGAILAYNILKEMESQKLQKSYTLFVLIRYFIILKFIFNAFCKFPYPNAEDKVRNLPSSTKFSTGRSGNSERYERSSNVSFFK